MAALREPQRPAGREQLALDPLKITEKISLFSRLPIAAFFTAGSISVTSAGIHASHIVSSNHFGTLDRIEFLFFFYPLSATPPLYARPPDWQAGQFAECVFTGFTSYFRHSFSPFLNPRNVLNRGKRRL